MDTRKARRMGYYVRQGEYQGTTDNRLGRWYIGREGHPFRPDGPGHPTARTAWAAVVAVAETPDACDARKAAARAMLATLIEAANEVSNPGFHRASGGGDVLEYLTAAIDAARAAGITPAKD